MFGRNSTINLGPETDGEIIAKVLKAIKSVGGVKVEERSCQVGGQDISRTEFRIEKSIVILEIETYEGVTIRGSKSVINKVMDRFKSSDK